MSLLTALALISLFYILGLVTMSLFAINPRDENEGMRPDARGPVRATLTREEETR